MLKLYENIKEKRLQREWTQTDLAKKMGYSDKSMIAKIEAGQVDLSQSKIKAFADVFNCTPAELMGWTLADVVEEWDKSFNENAKILYTKYLKANIKTRKIIDSLLEDDDE